MGSLIVPSTTLQLYSLSEYAFKPAKRHHGARGECTYFDAREQRTILFKLSVFMPFFQITLENTFICDKIN